MYTFIYYSFKSLSYGTEKKYRSIIFNVRFTIFLYLGVTLPCFQISGTTEVKSKLLKRSVSGADITTAIFLSILSFSESEPESFSATSDFNTDLTSST